MSFVNFKPTIWSKYIQKELSLSCILVAGCWRQFEGEAKNASRVKILGVGRPTIKDYKKEDIDSPEDVETSGVYLDIDQAKYFNFGIDDVDKAQMKPDLMKDLMGEAKDALAEHRDSHVGKQALKAGKIAASAAIATAKEAVKVIDAGLLHLREQNVPQSTEIYVELPWFMYYLVQDDYIERDTNNSAMLAKGILGSYKGALVRPSNNLYNDGTDTLMMLRTKKAIAFVSAIDELEAYRPEKRFSDAIKGLNVYGAKVVRPKELYAAKVRAV
jgi:hypothetical protein